MVHFKGSQCRSLNASVDKAASKCIGGVQKSSRNNFSCVRPLGFLKYNLSLTQGNFYAILF